MYRANKADHNTTQAEMAEVVDFIHQPRWSMAECCSMPICCAGSNQPLTLGDWRNIPFQCNHASDHLPEGTAPEGVSGSEGSRLVQLIRSGFVKLVCASELFSWCIESLLPYIPAISRLQRVMAVAEGFLL